MSKPNKPELRYISFDDIEPNKYQPPSREITVEKGRLIESTAENGILAPPIVVETAIPGRPRYTHADGWCRITAARLNGAAGIWCIVDQSGQTPEQLFTALNDEQRINHSHWFHLWSSLPSASRAGLLRDLKKVKPSAIRHIQNTVDLFGEKRALQLSAENLEITIGTAAKSFLIGLTAIHASMNSSIKLPSKIAICEWFVAQKNIGGYSRSIAHCHLFKGMKHSVLVRLISRIKARAAFEHSDWA
jgi:hypothetical protein